jgi:predicted TIM-barrel fold metal-dependent hydrolase
VNHVDFEIFDCDNHYYEALDAFTRYAEPGMAKRTMQWAEVNGKQRLLVGGRINRFIPNPTFDPVSKPGALDEYFRGRNPAGKGVPELFGELDAMASRPEYRDRDARLRVMDGQGIGGAIFLPTLGVGMEQALIHDPEAVLAAFRAFNRWIDDDWGFAYQERIFGTPVLSFVDPEELVRNVDWCLERDARFVLIVPGPIMTAAGGRSPADPVYDPAWARLQEAGVTVVIHGGDTWYSRYLADWGENAEAEAFRQNPFRMLVSHSPVQDYFANLLAHGFFQRFPSLRFASIETGSDWVFHLYEKLKKSWSMTPMMYPEDPRDTFRRHVWVSPFYEDALDRLRDIIGADRMLMGSDWPHAEGLEEPSTYVKDLENFGFSPEESRLVMRDNGYALATRRPA